MNLGRNFKLINSERKLGTNNNKPIISLMNPGIINKIIAINKPGFRLGGLYPGWGSVRPQFFRRAIPIALLRHVKTMLRKNPIQFATSKNATNSRIAAIISMFFRFFDTVNIIYIFL